MAAIFATIRQAVEEYHKQHIMSGGGKIEAQKALNLTSLLSQNTSNRKTPPTLASPWNIPN